MIFRRSASRAEFGGGAWIGLSSSFMGRNKVKNQLPHGLGDSRTSGTTIGQTLLLNCETKTEAIAIANDTVYGLSSYVTSSDPDRARAVARRIRAGMVHINGARAPAGAPFGGYKHSGNGRERGRFGFDEFLEIKAIFGYAAQ